MLAPIAHLVRRHPLASFFVLAFTLSWWGWLAGACFPDAIPYLPYPILPYGPAVAAFIVLALTEGKAGVLGLLRSIARWRVGTTWYVVALGLPVALYVVAVGANVLLGAPAPTAAQLGRWWTILPAFPLVILLEGGALEEPGWRGYALPRLLAGRSALAASLILGLVHAAWHLPLYIDRPTELAYIPLVAAGSVLFAWIFNHTGGSALLAILFHGALNTASQFFAPMFAGADATRLFWLLTAAYCLAALIVVALTGRTLQSHRSIAPTPRIRAATTAWKG